MRHWVEEETMIRNCGERPLLGQVLVQQGEVTSEEVEGALAVQVETGTRIGEILVERTILCGPVLDRALAEQSGVELQVERGFGTGLRAEIERRHRLRRLAFQ
jgi:hypothetical protein